MTCPRCGDKLLTGVFDGYCFGCFYIERGENPDVIIAAVEKVEQTILDIMAVVTKFLNGDDLTDLSDEVSVARCEHGVWTQTNCQLCST